MKITVTPCPALVSDPLTIQIDGEALKKGFTLLLQSRDASGVVWKYQYVYPATAAPSGSFSLKPAGSISRGSCPLTNDTMYPFEQMKPYDKWHPRNRGARQGWAVW